MAIEGGARRGRGREPTAGQGSGEKGDAGQRAQFATGRFVSLTVAGFVQHRVVEDRLGGAGVEREEDAEEEHACDVADHAGAEPAGDGGGEQGRVGHHQQAFAAPPIGQDAGRNLHDGRHHGVRGRHDANLRGVEAKFAHEEFFGRWPQQQAAGEGAGVERQQAALQSDCRFDGAHSFPFVVTLSVTLGRGAVIAVSRRSRRGGRTVTGVKARAVPNEVTRHDASRAGEAHSCGEGRTGEGLIGGSGARER